METPRKEKPRTDVLVVHVGDDVAAAVRRLARREGVTISSVVRRALLRELEGENKDGRQE